jgi:hypothetical protein
VNSEALIIPNGKDAAFIDLENEDFVGIIMPLQIFRQARHTAPKWTYNYSLRNAEQFAQEA